MAIVLILVAAPVLVLTRVPRWVSDGIPDGLVLSDVTVVPAVVLLVYLARALLDSHFERAIDLRPSDDYLRKEFARIVERSYFGVGRAREWTTENPHTSLASVKSEVHFDRRLATPMTPAAEPVLAVAEEPAPPVPIEPADMFAETEEYVVERGDSWWTLAVDRLNDGRRWTEIRDLNLNRTMPDGTILTIDAHLLEGFVIVLPVKVVDEEA